MKRDLLLLSELSVCLSGQIGNTESELKKLAEENPDLQDAYIAKQKRLKVRVEFILLVKSWLKVAGLFMILS